MSSEPGAEGGPGAPAVTVRRLREGETPAYRDVRLRSLRSDPLAFGSTFEREAAFPESVWEERALRAASSDEASIWVASSSPGRFVGLVGAFSEGGTFVAVMMWVDPEVRHQGIGGRLFDALLEWTARVHPELPVRLSVNPTQREAVRIYEGRGFQRTGRTEPLPHSPDVRVEEMVRSSTGSPPLG